MATVLVSVGSNIDPALNIPRALNMLKRQVRVLAVSMFYETAPLGQPEAPKFYNGAIKLETDLQPRQLKFDVLRKVEEAMGRTRSGDRYAPRTIDLDIAVYDLAMIDEGGLVVPDPQIDSRPFLAVPLAELEPDMALPGSNLTLAQIAADSDRSALEELPEFTDRLRQEICDEC